MFGVGPDGERILGALISEIGERIGHRVGQPQGFGNPNWGNRERLSGNRPNANGPLPILQFPEQAGAAYIVPECFTVAVNAVIDKANWAGADKDAAVVLFVTAGAGASYQTFEIDLVPGTQFGIVCNTLTMKALWLDDTNDNPNIDIIATIGRGSSSNGGHCAPTRTRRTGAVAIGGTALVEVPPFASAFHVLGSEPAVYDAANLYRVRSGPLATDPIVVEYSGTEALDARNAGALLLPANAITVEVVNNSGSAMTDTDIQFRLAL